MGTIFLPLTEAQDSVCFVETGSLYVVLGLQDGLKLTDFLLPLSNSLAYIADDLSCLSAYCAT